MLALCRRFRYWWLPAALVAVVGVLPAAAAPTLLNPRFEEGLEGWHPLPLAEGAIAAVAGEGREGSAAVRLSAPDHSHPWLAQGVGDIQPQATYEAYAWARQPSPEGRAAVKLEFFTADNEYLSGHYGLAPEAAPGQWLQVRVEAQAPPQAAKAAVILRLLGPGEVYLDEASLLLTAPPPPVFLEPARLLIPPQEGESAQVEAVFSGPSLPEPAPQALLAGPGLPRPQALVPQVEPVSTDRLRVQVPLPTLEPGVYRLQLSWEELGAATTELLVLPQTAPQGAIDAQGRFLCEGEPCLPLGVYHAAPGDFPELAAAGFSLAQVAPPRAPEQLRELVLSARQAGLRLVVPLYLATEEELRPALRMVEEFAEEPAIFGWLLADEPELRPGQAAGLAELYVGVHRSGASQPALVAIGPQADPADWAPLCDALLLHLFPAPGEQTAPSERLRRVTEALRPGQPWLAVLPAGWPGQAPPATEQARADLYRALAAGAAGALWFSLREGDYDLTQTSLWADLPELVAEARELAEALSAGAAWEGVEVSVDQVASRAVRQGDLAYLVLLSETDQPVTGVVQLPEPISAAAVLGEQPEPSFREDQVRFTLPPRGALALRLTLAPPSAAPEAAAGSPSG